MATKTKLTARQQEIFSYIKERTQNGQLPPTVREIGEHFSISSTNGVRSILSALIKKGYIKRSPKLSRGLSINEEMDSTTPVNKGSVAIPIVGRVAAGVPITAVQNLEGNITVDRDFLMNQDNVFALKVQGDSMKDAGIFNGDLVFARQQQTAEKGQIVIAMVDDEATVKYFHPETSHIRLDPANEAYRPIIVNDTQEFSIAGRVIGVMRQI